MSDSVATHRRQSVADSLPDRMRKLRVEVDE